MKAKKTIFSIQIFFLIALFFLPCEINAQDLTLNELILFQKNDVSEINDILISKGWSFSSSRDVTTDYYGDAKWAYDKNRGEDIALAWLTVSFSPDGPSQIAYQTSSKQVYLNIKQSIISYGMKKVNSKVGENKIITDYQGKNYTVRIQSSISKSNDFSNTIFYVFTKDDYDTMILSKLIETYAESKEIENSSSATIKDIDGNEYTSVKIGDQTWMIENLKVTHYRNGDPIQNITENSKWSNLSTGAWCYYNNMEKNDRDYGKLYNWYAVNDIRNIAPLGWHVPTDSEWATLINYLGGKDNAPKKLKETGTTHWKEFDSEATNSSRFNALPGGQREDNGSFFNNLGFSSFGNFGTWWSSSEKDSYTSPNFLLMKNISLFSSGNKKEGHSIRCVKDK